MRLGIDLEQYVVDPQSSGIQRVLQQLARTWPSATIDADFVVPSSDGSRRCSALLTPAQADELVTHSFSQARGEDSLHERVRKWVDVVEAPRVDSAELLSLYDAWLVPEVSYLPPVLERTRQFQSSMPTTMIAYDVLPMIDPANYRFVPGTSAAVSEYFRLLADADALVCISEWTRQTVLAELRRDPTAPTVVASPGADHHPVRHSSGQRSPRLRFLRVGTLEDRKEPLAILEAFTKARTEGAQIELTYVGRPSASHAHINQAVRSASDDPTSGVRWIDDADDEDIWGHVAEADVFLSVGTEGFGIPVVEALLLGTPVLFSGIQPAAELMDGKGARRIDNAANAFAISRQDVDLLTTEIDISALPRWNDFSEAVARTVIETLP